MIVYQATKAQFLHDNDYKFIEKVIEEEYNATTGKSVAASEKNAWKNSLKEMARVLEDTELPETMGVAVELHIPQTSKRVDVTLTGFNAAHQRSVLLVELKQWSEAKATSKDGMVRTVLGGNERETVHPSYQAWSYASLLHGFNEAVHTGGIKVNACAYLHNYVSDGVLDAQQYEHYTSRAPLFMRGKEQLEQLRAFIKTHITEGDELSTLHELVNSPIRPSKVLADSLKANLKAQPELILIDDQKEIFEAAKAAATAALADKPRVVIIQGGPGTGKTVVALNLLAKLSLKGLNGRYVSKNAAPRKVYESKLVGKDLMKRSEFSNLFAGSGSFVDTGTNAYDFLVVDEAHRLNEKSGLYGNLGENQIKELINASACTIFFIDEDQRVTLSDIGSREAIREFAEAKGAEVEEYTLASQFRCNGSDGYLAWLDDVLQVRPTANRYLDSSLYEFKVFGTPEALHAAIKEKNSHNKARVVAGYCWPWTSKKEPSADDIVIGEHYRRKWNLDQDGSLWIIAENSVEQVGCIHTCQGLEVDYIGVIIGPDLVIRDGQVLTDPSKRDKQDRSIRGYKTRMKTAPEETRELVDLIIKNTYRTLMTRGMKGCYIYCSDEQTAQYFRSRARLIDLIAPKAETELLASVS
ncbi:DNA/RNA helicase domain-containing protein [Pseudomonas sp. NPDC089401]|uniref:DNA/RNA helicase domain-containing protein n=1 Tax=Pseudomonas sp. NPDC089401 TaxID=3364462 RepID=UPI0037FB96E9